MIREALENIEQLAVKATKAEVIKLDNDRSRAFVLHNGEIKTIELKPDPRSHTVFSLADFMAAVQRWGEDGTVWHDEKKCVLVVNDSDRWDRVVFPLLHSSQFTTLCQLEETEKRFMQREFVRLLRHELAGAVPDFILPRIRKIEATSNARQSGDVQHGRERGTREFQAELSNAEDIPEKFEVVVPVYQNLPEIHPKVIRVNLEITLPPQPMDFQLLPVPDACTNAERAAQMDLHALLVADFDDNQVFYGNP